MFHASAMFHGRGAVVQAEALLVLLVSANVPRSGSPTRIVISNFESRIFAKLIPRFKGASGAGGLLLNTKASQEAACSRAPDAIVPDQEPESHDAGVSRFGENGSHPAAADAAEGYAGQVDGPGSSRNAGTGSHLEAADAAEGHAGPVGGLGSSEFTKNG